MVKQVHDRTDHEGPEGEYRYSSTRFLTSALDGVVGQRHAPAALPPGKTRYPLYKKLGGPQGRGGRVQKISIPPGFDPRTVQPVASRCTDWAVSALPWVLDLLMFDILLQCHSVGCNLLTVTSNCIATPLAAICWQWHLTAMPLPWLQSADSDILLQCHSLGCNLLIVTSYCNATPLAAICWQWHLTAVPLPWLQSADS